MDWVDRSWTGVPAWPGGLDERGFTTFGELAMALAPLRRVVRPDVPASTGVRDSAPVGARDGVAVRGRPGKRW